MFDANKNVATAWSG